jgi:HEAT repeat protein
VRASAAYVLSQISNPQAAEILIPLENDLEPRVREVAQKILKFSQTPTPPEGLKPSCQTGPGEQRKIKVASCLFSV